MDKKDEKKDAKRKVKVLMTTGGDGQIGEEKIVCCGDEAGLEGGIEKIIELTGRGNVVMTRLNDEDLRMIDGMVNLEVFSSRSEAVAYFTHIGLEQKKDMTAKVMPYIDQIKKLKEEAKSALK